MKPTGNNSDSRPLVVQLIDYDGPGGGPLSVVLHLRYLQQHFRVAAVYGGQGQVDDACREDDIPHIRVPIHIKPLWPVTIPMLAVKLRRLHPDVVVIQGQWGGIAGSIAARLAGVRRILYIPHWPAFYADWDLWRVCRNYICERTTCALSSRVLALCNSMKAQYLYRRWVREDRLRLIPSPVDLTTTPTKQEAAAVRNEWEWNDADSHVACVGRLAHQKRVDWLLRSWVKVQAAEPRARLWIVGDGPERAALEQLATDLDITQSCRFLGMQPRGIRFMAAADIVAVTSLFEAFGYAPVEAMSCGKPVVSNDVDGIRDTVRNGRDGYLVAASSTDEFAERLLELIRNPALRAEMGSAGRQRAAEFSLEATMPRYVASIREVLE